MPVNARVMKVLTIFLATGSDLKGIGPLRGQERRLLFKGPPD